MNRDEAKAAIERGNKVTHRFFDDKEFIELSKLLPGFYQDEKGYHFRPSEFWADRQQEYFNSDWSIFEFKTYDGPAEDIINGSDRR